MAPSSGSPPRAAVAIVGATASGKTAAAIEVARRLPVEVISADSRQMRCGMAIATAAPTAEELAAIPHHLVGTLTPEAEWSLAAFLEAARAALDDIGQRGRAPLLVGGTAQYVWALIEGWQVPAVPPGLELRGALEAEAATVGGAALHARLERLDPTSAARIDPRNVRRVVRALEIVESTGAPVQPLERRAPTLDWHVVGLEWSRAELHARADARVEAMYAAGLVEETRALMERFGTDLPALNTIGTAEARQVVLGEWTEAHAIERTKIETHRLIRMQATWFRRDDPRIRWVPGADLDAAAGAIVEAAQANG